MKRMTMLAATAALACTAACNSGASNNSAAANLAAPSSPAAPAPVAPPSGGTEPVEQAFVVGHWGPDASCRKTLTFEADGTARVSDDPRPGRWSLSGNTLTVSPPDAPPQPTSVARSGDNLTVTDPRGQTLTMIRCQAAAAQEAAGAPG